MVKLCDRCGNSFALPIGEQNWIESRAKVPKMDLCINCKISLKLKPASEVLPTRDRDLIFSSSAKLGLKGVKLPSVEGLKVDQPIPQFLPRGIKWNHFLPGRKVTGTIGKAVIEGENKICMIAKIGHGAFSSATLTVFPMFSSCETRTLVLDGFGRAITESPTEHTPALFNWLQIDEPFRASIPEGTQCSFFGIPAGQIPSPLCDAGHNMASKLEELARRAQHERAETHRVPRDVLAAQRNTVLCDPWGPPVKDMAALCAAVKDVPVRPYSCADYLDAIVDFAHSGWNAVTEHLQRWDEGTLKLVMATCAAAHDRLGAASPLSLLGPRLLRRIVMLAFPCRMRDLPKWTYIDGVASRMQPLLQARPRPAGTYHVNVRGLCTHTMSM